MERKTPLYDCHLAARGRMVPFAGYLLPVQYEETGVIAEHLAVRKACGLFDVSHMGEMILEGPDSLDNLNRLLTNDFSGLPIGRVRYSPMCNERGGAVDDLIAYRLGEARYMIVVNAANREKDFQWMRAHLAGDARLADVSDQVAELALQGPAARTLIEGLCPAGEIPSKYYSFVERARVGGVPCLLSRTGYTGELGYEIYCRNEDAPRLWNLLLEAGGPLGLVPCGLGCRDTLRLEAGMPLYFHELSEDITPLEAGLGWAVKMEGRDFIGRAALLAAGEPRRVRAGLRVAGKGIVREGQDVYAEGEIVGRTTSGTFLPYLQSACAMALLRPACAAVGTQLTVDVRGRRLPVEVVALPFYKRG